MPKTNEKDAYYFPHDCNARNDPKILALRSVYGAEGYGVYWMLVEILREQPDYKLQVTKYLYHTLAMQMQVQKDRLQEIVEACCNEFVEGGSPLLVNDGQYLYSASLLRRMEKVDDISKLRKEAARKRWENQACKDLGDADGCKPDADAQQEQSKEKQTRAEQIKAEQTRGKQKKADCFAAFAGGDPDLLAALHGYEEMRKKIKKPMTDEAKKRALNKLAELAPDRQTQVAILNQSEDRCWVGLFPLKEGDGSRAAGVSRGSRLETDEKIGALQGLYSQFSGEGDGL